MGTPYLYTAWHGHRYTLGKLKHRRSVLNYYSDTQATIWTVSSGTAIELHRPRHLNKHCPGRVEDVWASKDYYHVFEYVDPVCHPDEWGEGKDGPSHLVFVLVNYGLSISTQAQDKIK